MPKPQWDPALIVTDTREQAPLFVDLRAVTLKTGDYSIVGFEKIMAVERKSIADLIGSVGKGRARFLREIRRLAKFKYPAILVEGTPRAILAAPHFGRVTGKVALATLISWSAVYRLPVLYADDRYMARYMTSAFLRFAWEQEVIGRHDTIDPCECGGGSVVKHSANCKEGTDVT